MGHNYFVLYESSNWDIIDSSELYPFVCVCVDVSMLPAQPSLSHLALGLSVGTSALIAALLLAVSGVMISEWSMSNYFNQHGFTVAKSLKLKHNILANWFMEDILSFCGCWRNLKGFNRPQERTTVVHTVTYMHHWPLR